MILALVILCAATLSLGAPQKAAATQITDAKIVEVTERGFVLKIGTENLAVEDDQRTKFWLNKAPTTREAFKVEDMVNVRLKTDASPVLVREMADPTTAQWLTRIRKDQMPGLVTKLDAKRLLLAFEDRSEFSYVVSEKTKVEIKGKPGTLQDIKEGMRLYAKGQLMPSLDTRATHLSDKYEPPTKKSAKGKAGKAVKAIKLSASGEISGTVVEVKSSLGIVDIDSSGTTIHITINGQTRISQNGTVASIGAIQKGDIFDVSYKRDKYGRIIATKAVIRRP